MNRWMRSAAVAVALAASAGATAACGSGTQDSGSRSGATGGGDVTLTLTAITDAKAAWEELFALYKKVAPDVTFKASFSPTDQLQTALRAQLGGGNAPDLFVNWPGNGSAMAVQQLAPSGLVADISDQAWIKAVPDSIKPLLGTGGKTYMLPSFLAAAKHKADLATFPFPAFDDPDTLKIPTGVGAGIGASERQAPRRGEEIHRVARFVRARPSAQ